MQVAQVTGVPVIDLAIDTHRLGKQALVFVNTKRSAEATAEKIAGKLGHRSNELDSLALKAEKVLSTPTRQCRRLARCIRGGTAFHHAGLASGQRAIVEDAFKSGKIKIISSTPTLAFGINLPAYRAIVKDLKRYGGRWGMKWIPALEYHQMAGRAGRPDFNDKVGEAICLAATEDEEANIVESFITAPPEKIYSKLAVEPVLRMYCLSLAATGFVRSRKDLVKFFSDTFYGHQFGDMKELTSILFRILKDLDEWGFLKVSSIDDGFVSANELEEIGLFVTPLGHKVALLYIDPMTANYMIMAMEKAKEVSCTDLSYLSMVTTTLELRPAFRIRAAERESIEGYLSEHEADFIIPEPSVFDYEYDDFANGIKTAIVFLHWMEENDEEFLMERFGVTPGELKVKLDLADWIFYAAEELSKVLDFRETKKEISSVRFRLKHGIKEELIPLVRLRSIGRVRARKLYSNGVKGAGDIKRMDITSLAALIGPRTAAKVKEALGQEVKEIPKGKRKGQTGITHFL